MKDIRTMTEKQLDQFYEDDPEGYNKAVRNLNREVDFTYQDFARKNLGFDEAWKRGDIQEVMRIMPGHNAMSAYEVLNKLVVAPEYDPTLHPDGRALNSDLTSALANRLQKRRDSGHDQGVDNIPMDTTGYSSTVEDKPPHEERFEEFRPSPMSTVEGE